MIILVAGGAGFIGSHLCERLLEAEDNEIICLDNLATGRIANIASFRDSPRFRFIEADVITGMPDVPHVDQIYHLASPASPPAFHRHPVETLRANSEGTRHLLELARRDGARMLYASSSEVYGDPLEHPQTEEYRGNVSSVGPRSMYDEGKRYGEALTVAFSNCYGVLTRIARPFNTYGPRSDPNDGRMIPNFITQALKDEPITIYGDGKQTRSVCYVSDTVAGLIAFMDSATPSAQVLNIGNPEERTVLEYAEHVRDLIGSRSKLVFHEQPVGDDPKQRRPAIDKARALLHWSPVVSLEDGLDKTVSYFREELGLPVPRCVD